MLTNHVVLMILYAGAVAGFFALLWRDEPRDRLRLFTILFLTLLAGGILIARFMQVM